MRVLQQLSLRLFANLPRALHGLGCAVLFVAASASIHASQAHAAPPAKVVTVRRDGVGPLLKSTPVDPKVLQPMFKGCKLLPVIHSIKGRPVERTVAVVCKKKPLYTLHSETDLRTLAYVEVHAPKAVTQDRVAQGDKLERLYRLGQVDCDAGIDPAKRTIQCTVVGHSAFGYRLKDTGHGPAGLLPSPKSLKALTITGLIWRTSMI